MRQSSHLDVAAEVVHLGCGIFLDNVWACSSDLCTKPTITRRILVKVVLTIIPGTIM